MRVMGNKISAREFVKKAGVPITEGLTGNKETLLQAKYRIGLPVLLKAAAGGGGKGMQIVHDEKDLEEALESTSRQALAYFGMIRFISRSTLMNRVILSSRSLAIISGM